MENKQARLFILVGIVVAFLLFMHLLPTVKIGNVELRDVDILSDVLPELDADDSDRSPFEVNADSVRTHLAQVKETKGDTDKHKNIKDDVTVEYPDESNGDYVVGNDTSVQRDMKPLPQGERNFVIDYSGGSGYGLAAFYHALDCMASLGRPVRVAYWGDSYIEADILTCDLRERLQDRFGGQGPGWVDCGKTTNSTRPTVKQRTNGFKAHSVVEKGYRASLLGLSQRYFSVDGNASLTLSGTNYRKHLGQWAHSLLYFKTKQPMTITAMAGGQEQTFSVDGADHLQYIDLSVQAGQTKWYIEGAQQATFFGAALEGNSGVVVDNLALRGCAGMTLSMIPFSTMQQFAQLRPYDLLVLQYGLNATSGKVSSKWFNHYRDGMCKVVSQLKRAFPGTTILVVSVPDRGARKNGQIQTMSGIEELVEAQRQVAQQQGVVFLSLFGLMGGRNSVADFVAKKYVGHDYTHISFNGGRYLGGKIYEALMSQY